MNRQMTQQQRKSYPFNRSPEEAPSATTFLKFTGSQRWKRPHSQKPHGAQASQALKALVPIGSGIDLRIKTTDRYGRSIAEISRGGRNINQALVASGAAFVYWQYIQGCNRQTYSRLETEARLKGLGVWSTGGGITRPWDYRRGRRSSGSSRGGSSSGGRLTCKQIGSYARAQALLRQGHSYLDRDGDGQACEGLRG